MSRYCELKLTDVLKVEKPEMTRNRNKVTDMKPLSSRSRSTKTKLGNLSLLTEKSDSSSEDTNSQVETRETRLTNRYGNLLGQGVEVYSGDPRKGLTSISNPETKTGKRKKCDSKVENVEEPSSKKVCCTISSHTKTSNKPDGKITQGRKRKTKSRESCWENKLTGARRVSKRLSNLKIKKQKSLRDLGTFIDTTHITVESKQPINFSARGNTKANKELEGKSHKRNKPLYNRNRPEVQINFGKLSHTKRLYPKIAAGRRPATYTVTIKPSGSISQKSNPSNSIFAGDNFDEDGNDVDVNSLINKCVKDIQDELDNENALGTYLTDENNEYKSNDTSESRETAAESKIEEVNKCEVQTLVCDSVDDKIDDNSTIVIVNIETGENIECKTSEGNQKDHQNLEFGKIEEDIKSVEKQFDLEKHSEAVNIDDLKQVDCEEKSKAENNGLNLTVKDAVDTTDNRNIPTGDISETIDITATTD